MSDNSENNVNTPPEMNSEANRYNTMGITQATQNMSTQAIASFTKAIELNQNPGYWYNRGIIYASDGALPLAIQDFTRALELRGDDADILNNRGSVYAMLGEADAAIADQNSLHRAEP